MNLTFTNNILGQQLPTLMDVTCCMHCTPANFFRDISVTFLSWECWDFWRRHNHFRRFPKKSEVFRRCPKSSEDIQSLPKAKLLRKHLSTKSEIARKVLSFTHFTHGFRSLHGSELTYFWKLCQARRQQLTFSLRREKLAHKREPAWDRSFQPGGMRVGRYSIACCTTFETAQTFEPTTPISFLLLRDHPGIAQCSIMLDPFAQLFQHCWGHAYALHMVSLEFTKSSGCILSNIVSIPSPNIAGSCCFQAQHCQHRGDNSQHFWRNNVGSFASINT